MTFIKRALSQHYEVNNTPLSRGIDTTRKYNSLSRVIINKCYTHAKFFSIFQQISHRQCINFTIRFGYVSVVGLWGEKETTLLSPLPTHIRKPIWSCLLPSCATLSCRGVLWVFQVNSWVKVQLNVISFKSILHAQRVTRGRL